MKNFVDTLLGLQLQPTELTLFHITLRGIVVLAVGLVLMRLSDRRAMTKKSPFDQLLIIVLASVLARAINGNSAFFATLGAAALLVLAHRGMALVSCQWPAVAQLIKGKPHILILNGEVRRSALRKFHISTQDLEEDMRLTAETEEIEKIRIARLEPSGDVSFILKKEKRDLK